MKHECALWHWGNVTRALQALQSLRIAAYTTNTTNSVWAFPQAWYLTWMREGHLSIPLRVDSLLLSTMRAATDLPTANTWPTLLMPCPVSRDLKNCFNYSWLKYQGINSPETSTTREEETTSCTSSSSMLTESFQSCTLTVQWVHAICIIQLCLSDLWRLNCRAERNECGTV